MYDNEKIIKNIKIKQEINLEELLSLFIQLHRSIHHYKMDSKDIADVTKVVKKLV